MRVSTVFSCLAGAVAFATSAWATNWQPVATAGGEKGEIDKTRIMRTSPGSAVAWTRLVLGRELADVGGSYTAVQAMNRYDCENHKFATLKRVYMNQDKAVREETVNSPKDVVAAAGSVDEKLLAEACKLRTISEAHQVAEEAARVAGQAQDGKPSVMYADMRTAGETPKVQTMPVADGGKPEPKAEAATDTKIEVRPPSERPRFIGLPKMDKPQPAAEPEAKAANTKPAEARTATAKPIEKPAPVSGRQTLERQYATSGPRRPPSGLRKPAEEPGYAVLRHQEIHWGYEGEGSPANWAKLRPEFATCASGRRQSPIDIREGIRVDLEPIKFDYRPTHFRIIDNGYTVQVSVGEGSTISVMGRTYHLLQFHFHRPSEERINGKSFDMVIHFMHRDDQGRIAMIAVLLEKGAEHPLIQTLWNNMPLEVNQDVTPAVAIDPNGLLPENRGYYTYMGSLTTPPCTEDVLWMVFKQPLNVSPEQINIFARLYRNNARPVQSSNNRLVKENR
jgi:carbonic anhydrase